jgi:DNA-binding transcriptional regulator/RsmH inhibitor MraZ
MRPPLLVGEYELQLGADRKLRMPTDLRGVLAPSTDHDVALGRRIILTIGINRQVWGFPSEAFPHWQSQNSGVRWSPEVLKLFRTATMQQCQPTFSSDSVEQRVKDAYQLLKSETSGTTGVRLQGHDLEKLTAEVFKSHGCTVQMNVRVGGGEVDLLGLYIDNAGSPRTVLIECKQQRLSGKPVAVNQVMRLFSLWQATNKQIRVDEALLLSTSGFTRDAKVWAKLYNLKLMDIEKLREWTKQQVSVEQLQYPLFHLAKLSQGCLSLPSDMVSYLGGTGHEMTLVGAGHHFELWDRGEWEAMVDQMQQYSKVATKLR